MRETCERHGARAIAGATAGGGGARPVPAIERLVEAPPAMPV